MKRLIVLCVLLAQITVFGMDNSQKKISEQHVSKPTMNTPFYKTFFKMTWAKQKITKLLLKADRLVCPFVQNKNSMHKVLCQQLQKDYEQAKAMRNKIHHEVQGIVPQPVPFQLLNVLLSAIVTTCKLAYLKLDQGHINFLFEKDTKDTMLKRYQIFKQKVIELKEELKRDLGLVNELYKGMHQLEPVVSHNLTESKKRYKLSQSKVKIIEDYV